MNLGKQAWRIINDPNFLVGKTILPKYYKRKPLLEAEPKTSDSWLWKSILVGKDVCKKGLTVKIRGEKEAGIAYGKMVLINENNRS